jgi:hypothetical protein
MARNIVFRSIAMCLSQRAVSQAKERGHATNLGANCFQTFQIYEENTHLGPFSLKCISLGF